MDRKLKLPIGIDNFEKIRKENFYYVDKTKLIEQLLERWGEVKRSRRPYVRKCKISIDAASWKGS